MEILFRMSEPAIRRTQSRDDWFRPFTDAEFRQPAGSRANITTVQISWIRFLIRSRRWKTYAPREAWIHLAKARPPIRHRKEQVALLHSEDDDFQVRGLQINLVGYWSAVQSRSDPKIYVVQTANDVIQRCVLMTTDPGDLVLDPTCGSGTTAYVAEQWGRRWITIDTSRVALALARARIMGARYPFYLLADSREGQIKGSRDHRNACRSEVQLMATFAMALFMSAFRTSHLSPSRTTPRST